MGGRGLTGTGVTGSKWETKIGDKERRYSESEFALIIHRALELQEGPVASGSGEGLSLEEIKGVARELGLDPMVVERATRRLVP